MPYPRYNYATAKTTFMLQRRPAGGRGLQSRRAGLEEGGHRREVGRADHGRVRSRRDEAVPRRPEAAGTASTAVGEGGRRGPPRQGGAKGRKDAVAVHPDRRRRGPAVAVPRLPSYQSRRHLRRDVAARRQRQRRHPDRCVWRVPSADCGRGEGRGRAEGGGGDARHRGRAGYGPGDGAALPGGEAGRGRRHRQRRPEGRGPGAGREAGRPGHQGDGQAGGGSRCGKSPTRASGTRTPGCTRPPARRSHHRARSRPRSPWPPTPAAS